MPASALITGCTAGGIGDAMAREFHRRDFKVFATARDLDKVEHLRAMGCEVLQMDVTVESSIEAAVARVTKATGGSLDFLVNNAGRGELPTPFLLPWPTRPNTDPKGMSGHTAPLLDVDLTTARDVFDLNVLSVLRVTQQFAPCLVQAKGKVINIGSIGGRVVTPFTGAPSRHWTCSETAGSVLTGT